MKRLVALSIIAIGLNGDVIDSVCERFSNNINEKQCSTLREQTSKLENMLPRLTKKQRCKIIKESLYVFEVADGIIEKRYVSVSPKMPKKPANENDKKYLQELGLMALGASATRRDTELFIEFTNGFNELYNACMESGK